MKTSLVFAFLLGHVLLRAQPGTITEHLKIDQFGYPTDVEKICVINNPTAGFDFNAGDFYTPGNTLKLCKASDNSIVFSANITSWHAGASYSQSGDKAWWFNFSTYTTPGTYYVYDPTNDKRSFNFEIRDNIYTTILKHAVRMFYYQRSGLPKQRNMRVTGLMEPAILATSKI
jgi:hypothetical protein